MDGIVHYLLTDILIVRIIVRCLLWSSSSQVWICSHCVRSASKHWYTFYVYVITVHCRPPSTKYKLGKYGIVSVHSSVCEFVLRTLCEHHNSASYASIHSKINIIGITVARQCAIWWLFVHQTHRSCASAKGPKSFRRSNSDANDGPILTPKSDWLGTLIWTFTHRAHRVLLQAM